VGILKAFPRINLIPLNEAPDLPLEGLQKKGKPVPEVLMKGRLMAIVRAKQGRNPCRLPANLRKSSGLKLPEKYGYQGIRGQERRLSRVPVFQARTHVLS
jgi:hypothetical protein